MTREEIFERDKYTCQVCGKDINTYLHPQLAHIIPQRKWLLRKYGEEIIHNSNNMKSVCSRDCNGKLDLGSNEFKIKKKVKEIKELI